VVNPTGVVRQILDTTGALAIVGTGAAAATEPAQQ
jgi:hypothetical protein